jgi:hypothetical protein
LREPKEKVLQIVRILINGERRISGLKGKRSYPACGKFDDDALEEEGIDDPT